MKIFIDTNIFLDFYRSPKESIKILSDLQKHYKSIIFPTQVFNEYKRNRITIINTLINTFSGLQFPKFDASALILDFEEFKGINEMQKIFMKKRDTFITSVA